MIQLNTTNFDPNVTTKADWDFYDYMKYWLYNIIKHIVAQNTFKGYKRNVEVYLKEYFSMDEHKKTVKEITADDLDNLVNPTKVETIEVSTYNKSEILNLFDVLKGAEQRVYFLDKTKSKKGYRTLPIFPEIKQDILNKIKRIEECKKFYGNTYNYKYERYLFVHDNGNFILPNYFTKRFTKIIRRSDYQRQLETGRAISRIFGNNVTNVATI